MGTFGLAAIQLAGAAAASPEDVLQAISTSAKRYPWADMIMIGELAVNGAKLERAEPPGGPTETKLRALALELGVWLVPGSLYEQRDDKIYNTTIVVSPTGDIVARHDKLFPFLPYEKNVTSGSEYVVFDVPDAGRFGLAICYDIWFPEAIRTLAMMGADVILAPTRTNTIDRDIEVAITRSNAAINQCYVAGINIGAPVGLGRSVICGPGGDIIHECGGGFEAIAVELDFDLVRRCRERGWHGLGQTLKSFRDAPVDYPFHASPDARLVALDLGPLSMPDKVETINHTDAVKLKIVE